MIANQVSTNLRHSQPFEKYKQKVTYNFSLSILLYPPQYVVVPLVSNAHLNLFQRFFLVKIVCLTKCYVHVILRPFFYIYHLVVSIYIDMNTINNS